MGKRWATRSASPCQSEVAGCSTSVDREDRRIEADLSRYIDSVRRYCKSRVPSVVDAEDAAQDAFVRYLERGGDHVENPEAWLIQAASFECRDVHRRRRREQRQTPVDGSTPSPALVPDPERLATQRLLVQSLFDQLHPRDRELLALRYFADLSVEQVASRLSVSQGNARIMALRARRRAHDVLSSLERGVASAILFTGGLGRGLWTRLHDLARGTTRRVNSAIHAASGVSGCSPLAVAAPFLPALAAAALVAGALPAAQHNAALSRTGAAGTPPHALEPQGARADQQASGGAFDRSAATAGASAPGERGAVASLMGIVSPAGSANQQDAGFSSTTVSPAYDQDHTIYASGTDVRGCTTVCAVLFASHDGGQSWAVVPTVGFPGGQVLLSPRYPSDPTLFAIAPSGGLARADRNDGQFRMMAPSATSAAILPSSPVGAARVLLGAVPLTFYDAGSGLLSAGPALPPQVTAVTDVAFLGSDKEIAVAAQQVDPLAPGQQDGVILRCDTVSCQVGSAFPGQLGLRLAVSPAVGSDQTIVAYRGTMVMISRDLGRSFESLATSSDGGLASVAFDPAYASDGRLLVGGWDGPVAARRPLLLESSDRGHTLQRVSEAGLPAALQLSELAVLPDGHFIGALAVPDGTGAFGLRCSVDSGRHWALAC